MLLISKMLLDKDLYQAGSFLGVFKRDNSSYWIAECDNKGKIITFFGDGYESGVDAVKTCLYVWLDKMPPHGQQF